MASPFVQQMSARTEGWRESYYEHPEHRVIARYLGYSLLALVASRLIIEISRHITVLMPVGILAALVFSAFELALSAAGLIIGAIIIAAVIGLGVSTLFRAFRLIR